jgi:hypothetical protein
MRCGVLCGMVLSGNSPLPVATLLPFYVSTLLPPLPDLKKNGAKELAAMAMLSLVSDRRTSPLLCRPNELTGWTDGRFNTGMFVGALARLKIAVEAGPTAVQRAVSSVLGERLTVTANDDDGEVGLLAELSECIVS